MPIFICFQAESEEKKQSKTSSKYLFTYISRPMLYARFDSYLLHRRAIQEVPNSKLIAQRSLPYFEILVISFCNATLITE